MDKAVGIEREEVPSMALQSILKLSAKETLSDYVTVIAWSPTDNILAAASGSGEVRLLKNFVSLSLCQPTSQSIDALAFSFDGKWLAAGGQEGVITLWQMEGDVPEIADTLEYGSLFWIMQSIAISQGLHHFFYKFTSGSPSRLDGLLDQIERGKPIDWQYPVGGSIGVELRRLRRFRSTSAYKVQP
jgi:WD40 repeat protein